MIDSACEGEHVNERTIEATEGRDLKAVRTKHPLIATLDRNFTGYGAAERQITCIRVMCELGLIALTSHARKMVDPDPIVEIRLVYSECEANELLWHGWRLLGSSSTEPWEFTLARPSSVENVEQLTGK